MIGYFYYYNQYVLQNLHPKVQEFWKFLTFKSFVMILRIICEDLWRSLKDFQQGLPCSASVGLVVDVTLLLEEESVMLFGWLVPIFSDLEVFFTTFFLFLGKRWVESSFDCLSLWFVYLYFCKLVSAEDTCLWMQIASRKWSKKC